MAGHGKRFHQDWRGKPLRESPLSILNFQIISLSATASHVQPAVQILMAKWLFSATECNSDSASDKGFPFTASASASGTLSPSNRVVLVSGSPPPLAVLHLERLLINRFTVINGFCPRLLPPTNPLYRVLMCRMPPLPVFFSRLSLCLFAKQAVVPQRASFSPRPTLAETGVITEGSGYLSPPPISLSAAISQPSSFCYLLLISSVFCTSFSFRRPLLRPLPRLVPH